MADADLSDAAAPLDGPHRRQLVVRRTVQFVVDLALMTLLCLVPISAMWWLVPRSPDGTMKLAAGLLAFCLVCVACLLIGLAYWVWLPGRERVGHLGGAGQTPAMRWFRLRVEDQSGAPATRTQLAVRWLLLIVDCIAFGLVAVLAMLTTPRGQRVGDLLAGTVVVPEHHRRPAAQRSASASARVRRS